MGRNKLIVYIVTEVLPMLWWHLRFKFVCELFDHFMRNISSLVSSVNMISDKCSFNSRPHSLISYLDCHTNCKAFSLLFSAMKDLLENGVDNDNGDCLIYSAYLPIRNCLYVT
jgi:hypothetical protein